MHVFFCSFDLALTYSLRKKTRALARSLAREALDAAVAMRRPDLAYRANALLGAI